jgi:5-methylcytosine-specific restriction endonuclease McrA
MNQSFRAKNQSFYDRRWRKARKNYLTMHPLCVYCEQDGQIRSATVVDHIKPHKGNARMFWDESNWQALCQLHHDSTKQRMERSGEAVGCDINGNPLVKMRHW